MGALVDGLGLLALLVAYLPGSPVVQGKSRPIGYVFVGYTGEKCQVCMALTDDRQRCTIYIRLHIDCRQIFAPNVSDMQASLLFPRTTMKPKMSYCL